MQARSSDENSVYPSVCLSICLSVRRMNCNKTDFISYERTFSLVFFEKKEWLVGGPILSENLGQPAPVGAKSPILNR